MKIINRVDFLALPENTIFSKYEPCYIHEMEIKGETWNNDFLVQQVHDAVKADSSAEYTEILDRCQKTGESFEMDFHCQDRDGMFENEQLFVVWEKRDIENLIKRLQECLSEAQS